MVKEKNPFAKIYESGRILLLKKEYLSKYLIEPIVCIDNKICLQVMAQLKTISEKMSQLKDPIKLSILSLFSAGKIHVSNIGQIQDLVDNFLDDSKTNSDVQCHYASFVLDYLVFKDMINPILKPDINIFKIFVDFCKLHQTQNMYRRVMNHTELSLQRNIILTPTCTLFDV